MYYYTDQVWDNRPVLLTEAQVSDVLLFNNNICRFEFDDTYSYLKNYDSTCRFIIKTI